MKKILVIFIIFISSELSAQVIEQWSAITPPAPNSAQAIDIELDNVKNVYTLYQTSDSFFNEEAFGLVKYSPSGSMLWFQIYDTSSFRELPYALSVDAGTGDAYISGTFKYATVWQEGGTVKYDASGTLQWVKNHGGREAFDNTLDKNNNLYVAIFDQGVSVEKYDPAGNLLLSFRNDTCIGNDCVVPLFVRVDTINNIYVGGYHMFSISVREYFVKKFSPAGNLIWDRRYHPSAGADDPSCMVTDDSANVYTTGTKDYFGSNPHFATVKYDSSGNQIWANVYTAADEDKIPTICVDQYGNVYLTGYSRISTTKEQAIIKYNSVGSQVWVVRVDSALQDQDFPRGSHIITDNDTNVYISFHKSGDVLGTSEFATMKFDGNGNELWDIRYMYTNSSRPKKILIDTSGSVYVCGTNGGSNGVATVKYNQTTGIIENSSSNQILVFPNPSSGIFYLHGDKAEIEVYNVLGEKVYSKAGNEIDISSEPTGIYFARIQTKEQSFFQRIVIQK